MGYQQKKYKKFVATAATATLVASAIVPVASAKSFSDVAENNEFQPFIDALSDAKIINGYADGTFKPGNKLTRGQVVKMLGRWVESNGTAIPTDWNSKQRFNDVPVNGADEELVKYAALVKDAGVFTGSNGNLMAGNNITRQQMAKVLNGAYVAVNGVSLVELAEDIDNKLITDLSSSQQEFEGYIQALVDLKISTVSVFRPTENVTRAQFAKFLYNTINLDAVVSAGVKVINNTTVEVTFKDEIDNIKDINFAIEGLEVKNAVVKQTDKKTAVLTTASQKAGQKYTVTVDGKEVGTFTGVDAVVPTAVNIVEKSLQAPVGTQVTLKAQVTVKEGQSKEGIPVTFNIVNTASINTATLNQPIVVEATTNADGVATYTYTRYAQTSTQLASHDEVQAYATGNPTVRSFSKVYWASIQPLALTEVTQGNTIQNGGKKVYKVKVATEHAETVTETEYKNNTTYYNNRGIYSAGSYVNLGFDENTNVTPDKAVKTIDVIDATGKNLGYPGQYTTSTTGSNSLNAWVKEIKIKLDANGEAVFTLSGLDGAVTPYVFVDQKQNPNNASGTVGRFEPTELFAKAPKVTFGKQHTLATKIEAVGNQYAAAFYNSRVQNGTLVHDGDYIANKLSNSNVLANANTVKSLAGYTNAQLNTLLADAGGRDYKITVTDKNGKVAPKGTKVGVQLVYGTSQRTNGGAIYYVDNTNKSLQYVTTDASVGSTEKDRTKVIWTETDANGQVSFTLMGYKDAYVTPTAVIDSGNTQGTVDNNDQKIAGEIVYFSDARVSQATLTVNKSQASADGTDFVEFIYQTVDQNGKPYRPALNNLDVNKDGQKDNYVPVSFEVSTVFNAVNVKPGEYGLNKVFENLTGDKTSVTVGQDSMGNYNGNNLQYRSLVLFADESGKASIRVSGIGIDKGETNVKVTASTTLSSLPQLLTASAQLIGNKLVPVSYEGIVTEFNSATNTLTFAGKDAISYVVNNNVVFFNNTTQVTEQEFEKLLKDAKGAVVVKRELTATGNKFTIVSMLNTGDAPKDTAGTTPVQSPAPVTNAAFTDTDKDENQIAGEITFTASTSTNVTTKVYVGTTEIVKDANGKYVVTADTAKAEIKIVVKDNTTGLETPTTVTYTDLVDKAEVQTVTLKQLGFTTTENMFNGTVIITVKASTLPAELKGKKLSVTINGKAVTFVPNSINPDNLNITVQKADFNQSTFEALGVTAQ